MKIVKNTEGDLPSLNIDREGKYVVVFFNQTIAEREMLENFRCIYCGKLLFRYSSDVETIADISDTPKGKPYFEIWCDRCNVKYKVIG